MSEENNEYPDVPCFTFDNLDILGVFGDDTYLRGIVGYEDCVIVMTSELLQDSLLLWLRDKKQICEQYGHFCGAMGSVMPEKYNELDGIELLMNIEPEDIDMQVRPTASSMRPVMRVCRAFRFIKIEDTVDMEHG